MPAKRLLAALLGASVLFGLGACGGGDTTSPSTLTLSGKVIDGYISGAKVCLDLNNNFACDVTEPSSVTDGLGGYSIKYSGSIKGVQVLAVVDIHATDLDLGEITKPYLLLAPAERSSAITPMSTLVSTEMITSKATADEAAASVKATYNLKANPLDYDFKSKGDDETARVAQKVAATIAAVNDVLASDATIKAAGLTEAEIMKAAIKQAKDSVLPTIIKSDGTVDAPVCLKQPCTQDDLFNDVKDEAGVVSGIVQDIVYGTKSDDGLVASVKQVLEEGIIFAGVSTNGDYIDANGKRVSGNGSGYSIAPVIEYNQLIDGKMISKKKVYLKDVIGGPWFEKFEYDGLVTYSDGINWVEVSESDWDAAPFTFNGNCVYRHGREHCGVAHDLSGKRLGDFAVLCRDELGNSISSCKLDDQFPLGSFGYDISTRATTDYYDFHVSDWIGFRDNNGNPVTDLTSFIDLLKTSARSLDCNFMFSIDTYDLNSGLGQIKWEYKAGTCSNLGAVAATEKTNFKVTDLAGKKLMIIDIPTIWRDKGPDWYDPGCKISFAIVRNANLQNGLHDGEYCPANVKSVTPLISGKNININKTLLDFILKERGMTPFPYNQ